ncbi:MAG: NUDIX hydrolase [Methylacidiphilales bacterium]|nr:NUDIX hydrolase [Candidatus Methylacidiphilales bacterium]
MSSTGKNDPSRELSRETLASGRFLNLQSIRWKDARGSERVWEMAARNGECRAVLLISWLMPSNRLLLISQYRPPAQGLVIEFPAGLIDGSETPEIAALRELKEETGYHGRVVRLLPAGYNTPGLSSERTHVVLVEIDETLPENIYPVPGLGEDEEISVLLLRRAEVPDYLARAMDSGLQFDSKVLAYLAGLVSE